MKIANARRAEQRARDKEHRVLLKKKLSDGALFEVHEQVAVRAALFGGGSEVGWDVYTVRWRGGRASDWPKAECNCYWGKEGNRGCWHVHAIRLEWERRDRENA